VSPRLLSTPHFGDLYETSISEISQSPNLILKNMKLILLLIPLILLSSCTIDWNGDRLFEKKRYCSELKTD
jgi:hypothetical protein